MKPKILLLDIETAPSLGWVWAKWETDVIDFKQEWYMLSFVAKWLGGKYIEGSLPEFRGYKKHPENDRYLILKLWKLFDEADIIIAHNGDQFDIRKSNARFAYYSLPPPSPYRTIDTLKAARRYFNFTSNKLDDLGRYLGYGRKLVHTGFHLWQGCMKGDKKAWKKMLRYNKRDVELLEKVYLHLRPWIQNHANVAVGERRTCPRCGASRLQNKGYRYLTNSSAYQRFRCYECGGWSKGEQIKLERGLKNI